VSETLSGLYPWLDRVQTYSFVQALVCETCDNALAHAYRRTVAGEYRVQVIAIRRVPARLYETGQFWFTRFSHQCSFKEYIEIAIVDGGDGLFRRLRRRWKSRVNEIVRTQDRPVTKSELNSELGCLRWVLSKERSTYLTGLRRGYGLHRVIKHATEGWGGLFYIRSGHSRVVRLPDGGTEMTDQLEPFPGTQVRVCLPVADRQAEIERVLRDVDRELGLIQP
jgi:hypothetical protein